MPETLISPAVSLQIELEQLYSKNQLFPRIKSEFVNCEEFNFAEFFQMHDIPEKFGFAMMVQMVLHKRADLPTMVGVLQVHADSAQHAADLLLKAAKLDLIHWHPVNEQFVIAMDISADVQEEINQYQFPLPMVVEPRKLEHNNQSAYMLTKSSVILKDNHHDNDVCLDHLNRMNAIKLCINENTANMVKNQWRDLDKPKQGESKEDFQRRVKAFEKFDRTSRDVIAKLTSLGNEFHLTHRYDKRGRTYAQGYHVNYQGHSWNKAVIELVDKELVQ